MARNPIAIVIILIVIECAILYISSRRSFKKYFTVIPPVFWIYFCPMVLAASGLLDPGNRIYSKISQSLLPPSLVLLLLSSDLKAIQRLGKKALIVMLSGSLGIMIGMPFVFFLFKGIVGPERWSGFGALSGSWIGGSANMIAVKEALGTPERIFAPMVVVDTIVPYAWMGLLITLSRFQGAFDRWNRTDKKILEDLGGSGILRSEATLTVRYTFPGSLAILSIAACAAFGARYFSSAAGIILASLAGIILSFTKTRKLEARGATQAGYLLLYFVLTTIGARTNISDIGTAAALIPAGCMVVAIHAVFILAACRITKAPMFLFVTASQANIGGVASTPVVAAIYQPRLASVGLLLAVLGNVVGTYLGIVTGYLCKWVAGV
ncbi:MAG: DUF819 family protein [Candidatus Omnitrophica bacterium]|nr:DUF819 family protein [Candidatus Omnitrophota bacterium]